jgi:hypothetical protein
VPYFALTELRYLFSPTQGVALGWQYWEAFSLSDKIITKYVLSNSIVYLTTRGRRSPILPAQGNALG